MGRHAKTQRIIDEAYAILEDFHPMTLRQVYYQLISRQAVKVLPGQNPKSVYDSVGNALVDARREGLIPWEWIEDRLRKVRHASDGWDDVQAYWTSSLRWLADGYSRAVWPSQPRYIEVWLEKDALSGIFADALIPYNVPLNVGRGYDSWSSIHEATLRYADMAARGKPTTILHFGDFDPSGVDMPRSLQERLAELACHPNIVTVSLTWEDVRDRRLPASIEPIATKKNDSRAKAFIAKFGDIAVELDALPSTEMRARIIAAIERYMDMDALAAVRAQEVVDRAYLSAQLATIT